MFADDNNIAMMFSMGSILAPRLTSIIEVQCQVLYSEKSLTRFSWWCNINMYICIYVYIVCLPDKTSADQKLQCRKVIPPYS